MTCLNERVPFPRPKVMSREARLWWQKYSQYESIWLAGGNANISLRKPHGIWLDSQKRLYRQGNLSKKRTAALRWIGIQVGNQRQPTDYGQRLQTTLTPADFEYRWRVIFAQMKEIGAGKLSPPHSAA